MHADAANSSPSLAVWEFAGLMVTYWCNARCAFCYVYSGPDRGGRLGVDAAVRMWRGLDRLAAEHGRKMRIHLAGGEPFGDWPHLLSIIRAARDAGLSSLEKVETNAFWATDDDITRVRLEQLDALGMERLLISADYYHQRFVPANRVQRCVRIARQVLGPPRVRVRWWDQLTDADLPANPERKDVSVGRGHERVRTAAAAIDRHKDRLTGRASEHLAPLLPRRPAEAFAGQHCVKEILQSRHVHIDAYGHVFPGVCAGIILGNAIDKPVEAVWREVRDGWPPRPVLSALVHGGSHALYELARTLGYEPRADGYADKCHLCTHVRQFLVEHGHFPDELGPRDVYANDRDHKTARAWQSLVQLHRPASAVGTRA